MSSPAPDAARRVARTPWPVEAQPRLRLATHARLADRRFAVRYGPVTFHGLHLHDYEARMRLGRATLAIEPGDVTLTPAGMLSSYDLPSPGHHLVVHFNPITPAAGASRVHLPVHLRLGERRSFAWHQLSEIVHLAAQQRRRPTTRAVAAQLFQGLLLWLANQAAVAPDDDAHAGGARGRADAAVRAAAALIEQRLHRPITVPHIARAVGLSQNYLARRFRARLGMTIPRYLLTRRIAVARELLTLTDLPIGEIAARVGIPDPHHFNKQFRHMVGLSPSAFRAREAQGSS